MTWAFMVFFAASAAAHEGPPYALYSDRAVGPYRVSLWGDPDVGTGTFFILVDSPAGQEKDDTAARLVVRPVSGRLPEKSYPAVREPTRQGLRFVARPDFDAEERWSVRVELSGGRGAGSADAEADVTPPDLGRAGMWLYALPILGVGALWLKALLTRRRA